MGVRRSIGLALALACAVVGSAAFGSAAVASDVDPSIAPETTRLMFVGDSITGSPGCWRAPVWVSLTNDGWPVDMVGIFTANECGDVTNTVGEPFDADNSGIGGITTTRMWIKLATDEVLETYKPQVIVMLLGTNDLLGGSDADAILAQYDKLLQLYRDYLPSMRVVVGTPPPLDSGVCGCDAEQAALAEALPAWAEAASTDESPVMVADLSTGFDPATDTDDGIHPNDAGNAKLAAAWTPVIEDALAIQPVPTSAEPPTPRTEFCAAAAALWKPPRPTVSMATTTEAAPVRRASATRRET